MSKRHLSILLLLLSIFCCQIGSAQSRKAAVKDWYRGFIVNNKKDTLRGLIKYDYPNNQVLLKTRRNILALGAKKVLYFQIADEILNRDRYFYSLPYDENNKYPIPVIFEVLYNGPLTLLAREEIVIETSALNYGYGMETISRSKIIYRYFILNQKGQIHQFFGKKKELLEFMGRKAHKVEQFIKSKRLHVDNNQDLIAIFHFYNTN